MTSNVYQLPRSHSSTSRERLDAMKQDGREAGRRMDRPNTKIPRNERIIIAKRLNDEIVKSSVKPGELCKKPEIITYGTRELDKMRWREGNKEDKELLASGNRYRKVIKALAELSHQNRNLLEDRITVGTCRHRLRPDGELEDVEKTLRGLEAGANEADRSLALFGQFRETLLLKCEGFARGELDNWPNYPLGEDEIPHPSGDTQRIRERWRDRLEGIYGFWGEEGDDVWSEGPDLDTLGYLPHAYLGILADWHDWGVTGDLHYQREARRELKKEYARIPTAVYVEGQLPEVVNTKEAVHGSPLSVHDFMHSWLILYPDRWMSKIIPVLLTLNADLGTIIEQVTPRKLLELGRIELIGRHPKAYDGVVELLAPPEGKKSLVQYWIETGQWFQQNRCCEQLLAWLQPAHGETSCLPREIPMSKAETSLEYRKGMPRTSLHALRRLRQRGLLEADLERLQRHGEEFDDGYLMSNRTIDEHITQLKSEIQRLERLKDVVLIEQDNTLVTVYRTNRRRQRRILSGHAKQYGNYGRRNSQ